MKLYAMLGLTGVSGVIAVSHYSKYRELKENIIAPFPINSRKSGKRVDFVMIGYPVTSDKSPLYLEKYVEIGINVEKSYTNWVKIGKISVPITQYYTETKWEPFTDPLVLHANSCKIDFKEFNGSKKLDVTLDTTNELLFADKVSSQSRDISEQDMIDFKNLKDKLTQIGYDHARITENVIVGDGTLAVIMEAHKQKGTVIINKVLPNHSPSSYALMRHPLFKYSRVFFGGGCVASLLMVCMQI